MSFEEDFKKLAPLIVSLEEIRVNGHLNKQKRFFFKEDVQKHCRSVEKIKQAIENNQLLTKEVQLKDVEKFIKELDVEIEK